MERIYELESKIRDCEILELNLNWKHFNSNLENKYHGAQIQFQEKDSIVTLAIKEIFGLDIFENDFNSYYISHIKCLRGDDGVISLCLDPYDERVERIEEEDNFILKFREYKILTRINENEVEQA